jgi:hypothetical protein
MKKSGTADSKGNTSPIRPNDAGLRTDGPLQRDPDHLVGRASKDSCFGGGPELGGAVTMLCYHQDNPRSTGLEPVTQGLEIPCSIQLSYER